MLAGIERKSDPGPPRAFRAVCHVHVPPPAAAQMVFAGVEIHQYKTAFTITLAAVPGALCRIDAREHQIDAFQNLSGGAHHAAFDTAHLLLTGLFGNACRGLGLWLRGGGWLRHRRWLLARGRKAE